VTGWRLFLVILGTVAACGLGRPQGAGAQTALDSAVRRAADAWTQHRTRDLVEGSDTVRLRIPGVAASAAVRPGQAARLLDEYLGVALELSVDLVGIRHVADDHAYAELGRRYQVRGTAEVREETVFLGFRRLGGRWALREVRIAP
jgi:hypothetical protein